MMMKKLISILTALCCIGSMSAMTSSASIIDPWRFSCSEGADGSAIITTHNRDYGFLIVTDGTELATIEKNNNLNDPIHTLVELGNNPQEWDWAPGNETLLANYNDTNRYYHVDLSSSTGWGKLSAAARNFMLTHEDVVDVILLEHSYSGTPQWYGDFEIYYHRDASSEEIDALDSNADISMLREVQAKYTDEEYIPDYAILSEAFAACEKYMTDNAEYSGCVDIIQPSLLIAENGQVVYSGVSAWEEIGDADGDGAVNATDAAAILEMASSLGTGAEVTVNTAADVNADGSVDAVDAAIVLSYASRIGSGENVMIYDAVK